MPYPDPAIGDMVLYHYNDGDQAAVIAALAVGQRPETVMVLPPDSTPYPVSARFDETGETNNTWRWRPSDIEAVAAQAQIRADVDALQAQVAALTPEPEPEPTPEAPPADESEKV